MALLSNELTLHTSGRYDQVKRVVSNARFEILLAVLLLLTAGAIIWKDQILERTIEFTPASTASITRHALSDVNDHGLSTIHEISPLNWTCELHKGYAYPYCAYELYFSSHKDQRGLNLTNMRALTLTLMYRGASTSFRVHMKNFDPRYSRSIEDDTPQFLRVEADTTPGKLQTIEFVPADFGVPDWWLRKHKLSPEFGRPQFDNITSMNFETGSEAPMGPHSFEIQKMSIRTAILSDAQWYSLLLGVWIIMIVVYLGFRLGNLQRSLRERRALEALALRDAQEAARRDHLTKVLNRRGLHERFAELLQKREDVVPVTIIAIDIDHFKRLNDSYGHAFGDQVLTDVAAVISRNVRMVDIVARWGGEEFIVVCLDADRRSAQKIAEKIRDSIERFDFGPCGQVTASFGIHWSPVCEQELSDLVELADIALYDAKASGRNCCKLHRPGMSKAA